MPRVFCDLFNYVAEDENDGGDDVCNVALMVVKLVAERVEEMAVTVMMTVMLFCDS